jgi:DNA repair protein RecO (recombination protein O)
VIRRIESAALLVRSIPYGEADLVATFFTREAGILPAIVRGARKSTKRFGGALEPIHELVLTMEDRGKELCVLKEARIQHARTALTSKLAAMEAAGRALRWVRHVCPARTPEPAVWRSLTELLDALDASETVVESALDVVLGTPQRPRSMAGDAPRSGIVDEEVPQHLAMFGLRLLTDIGYAIELDRCVRCGRPCPEGRSAFIDATGGGIVCTGCGGASRTISGELRALASRAQRNERVPLSRQQAVEIIVIVEEAISAHAGPFDRQV